MNEVWPWLILFGLGVYHGINPGMGWLFAVALGMQEKSRRAVISAILPIALGHALSIAFVVALLWLAGASLPGKYLRYGAAAILFGFGLYRLVRSRHLKWVGMRVGFRDLTLWSFLMASTHGAGLMLVPLLLAWPHTGHGEHNPANSHAAHFGFGGFDHPLMWLAAIGVHSMGHLLVTALIALLVYEKLGLSLLRRTWFNLDLLWIIALMLSSALIILS
jgi:hypothetical protein